MRAFYIKDIENYQVGHEISIEDESFQHIKVVRLKVAEIVMFLDGQGSQATASLISIEKKRAIFKLLSLSSSEHRPRWDLALGLVKKDAFDLCLKMATELGVGRIYPLLTSYSQRYELNLERAHRLLVQALEQSNSRWLPLLESPLELEEFIHHQVENNDNYSNYICMGMSSKISPFNLNSIEGSCLGFVGPEGGFSEQEEHELAKIPKCQSIHLPTPILRAPTAMASLAGVIFTKQKLLD